MISLRFLVFGFLFSGFGVLPSPAAGPPNVLWITAEDMSPTLGCYGDQFATTPHIDRLAKESVRYTHAFATAPVCSPSRSCLITGCYAPSLGTMQMRSAFPIPGFMTGFPSILRNERGYFTTNNVKTDYNTANWEKIIAASWDENSAEAHWRKNPDQTKPFFSIFNLMTSHQSRTMVWPHEQFVAEVQSKLKPGEIHDPAKVPLPPYYVDTPVVRKTVARFYDCVTAMDKEVGAILKQLDDDGLAEDTIVFFYSDHGSGMPRHKRALFDSGMHVPLLIRFPEKFRHLAPAQPGESLNRLVSFVDFGPTVLSLAGAEIPSYMQGAPFLGAKAAPPRLFAYGHRDRVDEAIDMARSVRGHRYLYIKNYMPHLGYNQPTAWPDGGQIRHEFYRLTDKDTMTGAQWQFAGPSRPPEELYDCEADPQNLQNLAESTDIEIREIRNQMRRALQGHMTKTMDLGEVPEIEMWKLATNTTPWEAKRGEDPAAARLIDPEVVGRYWAAVAAHQLESLSEARRAELVSFLESNSAAVRIEAASALARHGGIGEAMPVLLAALELKDLTSVMFAARAIELLGDEARDAVPAMEKTLARAYRIRPPDLPATVVASGEQDLAMFIGFSAKAFLDNVKRQGESKWVELFDGKSLDGWTPLAEGTVEAKDGEIQILAKGKNLWLLHEQEFGDFELRAEVKMPPDQYNSGIGFRCLEAKGKPKGYQCEVAGKETGMIYAIGSGWVWPKGDKEKKKFAQMAGDCFQPAGWNAIRIRAKGDRIRVWVNDVLTADVRDGKFTRGVVALQHHGKGGLHRFRNVSIRELP